MTKNQFIHQMEMELRKLSDVEREDILRDYSEYFDIAGQEGKKEEAVAAALGSPRQLAKELLAQYHMERVEGSATAGNLLRAVFAVISLGFFNLVFVLAVVLVLAAIILTGWVAGAAFVLSPLLVIVGAIVEPVTYEMFAMFFSLGLCGLGLLILVGMRTVTKLAGKGLIRYLRLNMAIVKGGSADA